MKLKEEGTLHYPPDGPRPTPESLALARTLRGYWRTYRRQTIPMQIVIGALAIFLSCAACTAFSQSMANSAKATAEYNATATASALQQAKQPTPTAEPTQPPTPTPKPDVVLFSQDNQHDSLPFDQAKSFQAQGKLHIEFSCIHDTKDGVDVQFNIVKMAADGTVDAPVWSARMSCFDLGSDDVTVSKGTYRATVSSNGDTGWSFKITQKP